MITRNKAGIDLAIMGVLVVCLLLGFSSISFAETDVTDKVQFERSMMNFDRRTSTNYFDAWYTNISGEIFLSPIKAVIASISEPSMSVANADGYTSEGKPYFEYALSSGRLLSDENTDSKQWIFANPERRRFSYTVAVFADLEQAAPPVSIYEYDAMGRIERVIGKSGENIVYEIEYEYDHIGNRITHRVTTAQ